MEIVKFDDSTGNVTLKVSAQNENDRIKNIVLWAEMDNQQEQEQHIGTFTPVGGHAYFSRCNGRPSSTITDYVNFTICKLFILQFYILSSTSISPTRTFP